MRKSTVLCALLLIIALIQSSREANSKNPGGAVMSITVTSSAFKEGGMIPKKYTCDDRDISPQLSWTGIPAGARSIALICDDPDAPVGTWVHWVVYNIPATEKGLPEQVTAGKGLPTGARQGINDFRKKDYGGPCPPGGTHRYFFKIYALDAQLTLGEGAKKSDLLKAMEGHVLGQGQLIGMYRRA